MINKKNRAGTSQNDKLFAALQPGYVSVEERSIADLLKYLREYSLEVDFYDETGQSSSGTWTTRNVIDGTLSGFLGFSDNELLEMAEFAENPELFQDDAGRLAKYSQPHLALLLTFCGATIFSDASRWRLRISAF